MTAPGHTYSNTARIYDISSNKQRNDLCLRLLYTSLELIRSSRVLAAGSAHNVLSVVTYQSV